MQTLGPELDRMLGLALAEASWSIQRRFLAGGDLNELFQKLLVVSLNLSLLHALLVLVDPLLVPKEPLLAVDAGHSCVGAFMPHGVAPVRNRLQLLLVNALRPAQK